MVVETDILVVGGGLSGLALADHLAQAGRNWHLVEARDRLGGRIDGLAAAGTVFDLGPAWFWPGQPRMAALAERFDVPVFEQYSDGSTLFEQADGAVQQIETMSAMAGSLRLSGGMRALVDSLAGALDPGRVQRGAIVETVARKPDAIEVTLRDGETIGAKQVVLAIPSRLAAGIPFDPPLPPDAMRALSTIPTWMGSMAKCVAVYPRPFWRDAGLSGDAMSRHGPMVEIHDASAMTGAPGALFGFIGVPVVHRARLVDQMQQACLDQFVRLFGDQARTPLALHLADWALDPFTAVEADHQPLAGHPAYGPPPAVSNLWDGALHVAVTETAPEHGGLTEGALAVAEAMAAQLIR